MSEADILLKNQSNHDDNSLNLKSLQNYGQWRDILRNIFIGLLIFSGVLIFINFKYRSVSRVFYFCEMVHFLLIGMIPVLDESKFELSSTAISYFLINLFFYVDLKLNMLALALTKTAE